ncbi:MAG: uL15 family ribosomal protein [Candidatus Kaiserbacteria bacterium]|nr:uL15 family ribosomal protein [Candidatus Kaiserbacteria bacterium]
MLHTLATRTRKKKRIGRGGVRGRKSGRGDKGQRSRAGRRIRPAIRDELQRIPKRRGHNRNRARGIRGDRGERVITLQMIDRNFSNGETVTPKELITRRIIGRVRGREPRVSIVSRGDLSHSVTIRRCRVSASAQKHIEEAGGAVH